YVAPHGPYWARAGSPCHDSVCLYRQFFGQTSMEPSIDVAAPSPSTERISAVRSRLLVLMFTDLVGSTALKEILRVTGYMPLLRRHDALLREAVASAGGQLQQDTGDGCFAFFATSSDAVNAALVFQWM